MRVLSISLAEISDIRDFKVRMPGSARVLEVVRECGKVLMLVLTSVNVDAKKDPERRFVGCYGDEDIAKDVPDSRLRFVSSFVNEENGACATFYLFEVLHPVKYPSIKTTHPVLGDG